MEQASHHNCLGQRHFAWSDFSHLANSSFFIKLGLLSIQFVLFQVLRVVMMMMLSWPNLVTTSWHSWQVVTRRNVMSVGASQCLQSVKVGSDPAIIDWISLASIIQQAWCHYFAIRVQCKHPIPGHSGQLSSPVIGQHAPAPAPTHPITAW